MSSERSRPSCGPAVPAGSKTFRFNPAARADLRSGVLWYEERRERLGERFAAHVKAAIDLIVQGPERWPVRRGTHRYVLRSFPYTLAYRVAGDEVVFVAVAHHRLDPDDWETRRP